jgi:hypothetical protein
MKMWWILILAVFVAGCTVASTINDDIIIKMVSNTEYWNGENGQIIVALRDINFNPKVANCTVSILYPNSSYYKQAQNATSTNITGTYHYNFIVPEVEGVYEYMAFCKIGIKNYTSGNSFHVSNYRYFFEYEGEDSVSLGNNVTMGWREQTTDNYRSIINATCNIAGTAYYNNNNRSFQWVWYVNNSNFRVGREYNLSCTVTADNTTINLTKYFRVDKSLRAWAQK